MTRQVARPSQASDLGALFPKRKALRFGGPSDSMPAEAWDASAWAFRTPVALGRKLTLDVPSFLHDEQLRFKEDGGVVRYALKRCR